MENENENEIPEMRSVTWDGRNKRFLLVDSLGGKHTLPSDFILVRSSWLKRYLFRLFIFWWMVCVCLVVVVSFLLPRWIAFVFTTMLINHG